jgi:hypothetical protein
LKRQNLSVHTGIESFNEMHQLSHSFLSKLCANYFQESNMTKILIADLFADTDSALTELSENELQVSGGGGHGHGGGYGGGSKRKSGGKKRGSKGKGGGSKRKSGGSRGGYGGHGCYHH